MYRDAFLTFVYLKMIFSCKKKPGTTTTLDAGQAYEQTDLGDAICDLVFAAAWAWTVSGEFTVTVCKEVGFLSHMGGKAADFLDFRYPFVCFKLIEICSFL